MKNRSFLLLAVVIAGLAILSASKMPINAQNAGAIWTTTNSCGEPQNVNEYSVGDQVYINGANFASGSYNWDISGQPGQASCDPGQTVASGNQSVNDSGSFCISAYTIQGDDCGTYNVSFDNKSDNYRVNNSNAPTATPTPTSVGEPTATPTPTNGQEPSSTPTPTPTTGQEPTATPTPVSEPTATPVITVAPSNTPVPTVTQVPGQGKQSSLSYDVSCDKDEVKANMLLTDNGEAVTDVEVRFDYNGTKKEAMTGSSGRAVVMFAKDGENWLMAEADGFETRRYQVEFPECPASAETGVGGAVLGASTTQGQVLGASTDPSTFADTGLVTDFAAIMAGIFGVVALAKSRVIG